MAVTFSLWSVVIMRLLLVLLMALCCPSVSSEVLDTFDQCSEFFFKGQPPVIPNVLNPNQEDVGYKKICQKSDNKYTFATLYDTSNRIPVFSAFKYTGRKKEFPRPPNTWRIEPQLDPSVRDMTVPYTHQAIDEDYENGYDLNRGHLFPNGFAADEFTAKSTFTLTNIVPQYIKFNGGSWNQIERNTRNAMDKYCKQNNDERLAHGLIGAVPGNKKLNDRVNIPSLMWMAFCCYDSNTSKLVSEAYWALNQNKTDTDINKISLDQLKEKLSQSGLKIQQLFKDNCTKKNKNRLP